MVQKSKTRAGKGRTIKLPSRYHDFETKVLGIHKTIAKKNKVRTKAQDRKSLNKHSLFANRKDLKINNTHNAQIIKKMGIVNMTVADYIPSVKDNSDLVSVKEVNLLKNSHGKGLFANNKIPAGTCLGLYTGLEYTVEGFKEYISHHPQTDYSYAMTMGRRVIDASEKGNFTRYINFSDGNANVEFVEAVVNGDKVVKVIVLSDIQEGQQILVDYNTYDKRASKDYYFLNPSDGWQSSWDVYQANIDNYTHFKMPHHMAIFGLKRNDTLYVGEVSEAILLNQSLEQFEMPDSVEINLPCLKATASREIMDFDKADAFSPLMLACYLGQTKNVQWLVSKGAVIDQQQNHSGNCPLFLALEGYAQAAKEKKLPFLKIMSSLISSGANVFVHDRKDMSFLHKAICILSDAHFNLLVSCIKKNKGMEFNEVFNYIDENTDDVVHLCLRRKQFNKFMILIENNPSYFEAEYNQRGEANKESFRNAIADYDENELLELFNLLTSDKIQLDDELLEELGFEEQLTPAYSW